MALAAGGYYPPVGFHFAVHFRGIGNDNDIRFQSVSGLSVEFDTETFKEGGENRFEHKLPTRGKYPDLSLKRGMLLDSLLIRWLIGILHNRDFVTNRPADIDILLLNDRHTPIRSWNVKNAWPRKWSISDFNAAENVLVIETLDLSYSYFTLVF